MKKILLIGCGHMGSALLDSWIVSKKYSINIIDPKKNIILKKKYKNKKIKIFKSFSKIKNYYNFDFIVLSIRPFDLNNVLDELSNLNYHDDVSLVSVVAGKKINIFRRKLKRINNIFRVMPNMPASIGQSMNCIVSYKNANTKNKNYVQKLFSYSGETIFLKNENQIDMATAVSGSGPGFIYNIVDAMEKAAMKLGFKKDMAKILVTQTFKGSINLLLKNNISAEKLVKTVATKGGTTEAGLKIMNDNKIHKVFIELLRASYKKAKQQAK